MLGIARIGCGGRIVVGLTQVFLGDREVRGGGGGGRVGRGLSMFCEDVKLEALHEILDGCGSVNQDYGGYFTRD